MDDEEIKLYTVPEIAKLLHCEILTVRKLINTKQLVGKKFGRQYLVTKDNLKRYIQEVHMKKEDDGKDS